MLVGIDASRTVAGKLTGTEYYAVNLIQAIATLDQHNQYRLYFNVPFQKPIVRQENFQMRVMPFPRLWTQLRLALECLLDPPQILFVPSHTLPVIRSPKTKTIVTVHDLGAEFLAEYHQFPQKLYLNRSTEYVARHADHLIAVSNSTKNDLQKIFQVPEKRVTVVYEGVDLERFKPLKEKKDLERIRQKYQLKNEFLLFVGTIQPRKNLANLIEAFALYLQESKKNIDLVLVGKKGWLTDEIYAKPKLLGIQEKVFFLDYVAESDLPYFYNLASLFVLPSLYEGFGLPILEAMACGCPVAGSDCSSIPEVIGEAGLLFNPNSPQEISRSIHEMLENENLRAEKISQGLKRVKGFSWEKAAQKTLQLFEKIYHES